MADLVLVDEADAVLGNRPRRYGHIVVDEAQDLSPMAWRMIARRCSRFPSMTVLGDLAQATAPAAQRRWADVVAAVGSPSAVHLAELEIGYRVPGQILDVANGLLPATGAHVAPSRSVRSTPRPPRAVPVEVGQTPPAVVAEVVAELASRHQSVAVIVPTAAALAALEPLVNGTDGVQLLAAADAKGLEFDGVVVVEPAELMAGGERGARLLYIAMTRAVQELVLVHEQALPVELAAVAADAPPAAPA